MNRNYIAGRRLEYRAIALLRQQNFECIRAPASKGYWDIIAWDDDHLKFIQVKKNRVSRAELQTLKQALVPRGAKREVWIFKPRKALRIVTP